MNGTAAFLTETERPGVRARIALWSSSLDWKTLGTSRSWTAIGLALRSQPTNPAILRCAPIAAWPGRGSATTALRWCRPRPSCRVGRVSARQAPPTAWVAHRDAPRRWYRPIRRWPEPATISRCRGTIAPIRWELSHRFAIGRYRGVVGTTNATGAKANAHFGSGRWRLVVTRVVAVGRLKKRPRLLVFHRAPWRVGITVGSWIGSPVVSGR